MEGAMGTLETQPGLAILTCDVACASTTRVRRRKAQDMKVGALLLLLMTGGAAAAESDCREVKDIILAHLSIPGSGAELRVPLPPHREALLELPLDIKDRVLLAQLRRSGEALELQVLETSRIDAVEADARPKSAAEPVRIGSARMGLPDLLNGAVLHLPLGASAKGLGLEVRASSGEGVAGYEALLGRCPSNCCCTANMICCPTRSCIDCGGEAICCPRQEP